AFLGSAVTPYIVSLLAIGELVTDKLPKTPGRRQGLSHRAARRRNRSPWRLCYRVSRFLGFGMTTNPMQLLSVQGQAVPYLSTAAHTHTPQRDRRRRYTAHNWGSCNREQDEI
ncbi:MAG TPA: hypothetical protein VHZ55_00375, partial [Bryobacteraceae bacterium]|nr:hypothetical protein [Bryobacteraceae bacterium]